MMRGGSGMAPSQGRPRAARCGTTAGWANAPVPLRGTAVGRRTGTAGAAHHDHSALKLDMT